MSELPSHGLPLQPLAYELRPLGPLEKGQARTRGGRNALGDQASVALSLRAGVSWRELGIWAAWNLASDNLDKVGGGGRVQFVLACQVRGGSCERRCQDDVWRSQASLGVEACVAVAILAVDSEGSKFNCGCCISS